MEGNKPSDDELTRRRLLRERLRRMDQKLPETEDIPKFSWSDTFAMIIAAYQVLLPMLFAMIGVMIVAYLLFQFIFS